MSPNFSAALENQSKDTLLARAKTLGIKGRHDLSKEDLVTAIRQRVMVTAAKPTKRLVKNTNVPWRRKFYYLDLDRYEEVADELKKQPSQVQLMLKFMFDRDMTSVDDSEQGGTIAGMAISTGAVKSKIDPPVLFAYYRSTMENYGLVFAGYNIDK